MQLMSHQIKIIERAKTRNFLLAWEPGTGKTLAMLEILKQKYRPGFKTLVICPILVISNAWVGQIEEHTNFSYSVIYDAQPKKRLEKLRKDVDIYLINYEQFKILSEKIRAKNFDALIIDESSKLKSSRSQITKCSLSFAGFRSKNYPKPTIVPHRYALSGDPAPNSRDEFWGQISFVQPGLFNRNYYAFRDHFFYSIPLGPGLRKWEFRKSLIQEFETTVAPAVDVVRKEEALDLPPVMDVNYNVELSAKEFITYNLMKTTLVLELGDVQILSQYQISKMQKLRQLACGFIYDAEKNVHWIIKKTAKETALLELIEKLAGRSVVIWADFRPLYPRIRDLLGGKCAIVDKKYGDPQRILEDFTAGKNKIIIANPASCGHGIDKWQKVAFESIYYTDNWSWELRKQTGGRLHRIGQKNKVTNYHIIAQNTIDSVILQRTNNKKKLSELILKHLKGKF